MANIVLASAIVAAGSYLLGSISFAVIISRIYARDDVRKYGSGNAGMTNVLRTYGKLPAVLTTLGDFFKAVAAVALSRLLFGAMEVTLFDAGYLAGIFVVCGHLFPVFFGFKGGKGVLTVCGVMLTISPPVFALVLLVALPIIFIWKMVSLGVLIAAIAYPVITYAVLTAQGRDALFDALFSLFYTVVLMVMHRENIKRLLNGTENKFGSKK